MGSVWEGDDYIAFVTHMKGFTDDCQGMVTSMKKYSDFLKQSARIYRDTQKEIITAARR